MRLGRFITIEGGEGAGKSTALRFIEEYLCQKHLSLLLTREPGGTPLAEQLRELLLQAQHAEKVAPLTELLLMFAARAQHIAVMIQPALEAGKWVVSDRFIDASYAYQVGGRKLAEQAVIMLDQLVVASCYPDLTILLDLPPELGMQRRDKRGTEKDRIEQEKIDFFARVRETYLQRAKADPKRIKIVDARVSIPAVQLQIQTILDDFLESNA